MSGADDVPDRDVDVLHDLRHHVQLLLPPGLRRPRWQDLGAPLWPHGLHLPGQCVLRVLHHEKVVTRMISFSCW